MRKLMPPSRGITHGGGQQGGGPEGGPGGPPACTLTANISRNREHIKNGSAFFNMVLFVIDTKVKKYGVKMLKKYKQGWRSSSHAFGQKIRLLLAAEAKGIWEIRK